MNPHWPTLTFGDPALPPIVFLHGFMGRGQVWQAIAQDLSSHFYCICPDLPGHGANTQRPLDQTLSFETISQELIALLNSLDLEQTILVGYSMGGRIALYTALHHPSRIQKLVIESGSPGIVDEQERQARAALDDQRAENIRQNGLDTFIDKWYQAPLFASLHRHPDLLAQTIAARKQNDPAWVAKVIAELSPGRQPSLWHFLPNLKPPVMFLTGNLDDKYSQIQRKIMETLVGKHFVEIADAGHNTHLESPDQFTQNLKEFIA